MYERVGKLDLTDSFIEQTQKISALKRMAEPSEIGEFIMFVASEKAQFITGALLDIDGGLCCNAMPAPDNLQEQLLLLEPQSHGIS
jgi:NAD(P)-dependent dehydrogenase (short-subunit alcohol dehydrogenase family)